MSSISGRLRSSSSTERIGPVEQAQQRKMTRMTKSRRRRQADAAVGAVATVLDSYSNDGVAAHSDVQPPDHRDRGRVGAFKENPVQRHARRKRGSNCCTREDGSVITNIIAFAVLSRIVVIMIAALTRAFVRPYDTSIPAGAGISDGSFVLQLHANDTVSQCNAALDSVIAHTLGPLAHWDGLHFLRIAGQWDDGVGAEAGYTSEKECAFFPFLPWTLHRGAALLQWMLSATMPKGLIICDHSARLVACVLVNIGAFSVAAVFLYLLGCYILVEEKHIANEAHGRLANTVDRSDGGASQHWGHSRDAQPGKTSRTRRTRSVWERVERRRAKRVAFVACTLFCVNPGSIFFSAVYTESLFSMFTFAGIFFAYDSLMMPCAARRWMQLPRSLAFVISLCFCMAAASSRSNGITLAVFFAYIAVRHVWLYQHPRSITGVTNAIVIGWNNASLEVRTHRSRSIVHVFVMVSCCAFACVCVFIPSALHQVMVQRRFCGARNLATFPLPPYCPRSGDGPILSWFRAMEAYSWIQSKYWNVGAFTYWRVEQIPNFLLAAPILLTSGIGLLRYVRFHWKGVYLGGFSFFSTRNAPFVLLWALLAMVSLCIMHVQVATRFLCSSCPAFYWFLAEEVIGRRGNVHVCRVERYVRMWCIVYNVVGIVLFSAFLPWT